MSQLKTNPVTLIALLSLVSALPFCSAFADEDMKSVRNSHYIDLSKSDLKEPQPSKAKTQNGESIQELEAYMLSRVNKDRTAISLPSLKADPVLSRLARETADAILLNEFEKQSATPAGVKRFAIKEGLEFPGVVAENTGLREGSETDKEKLDDVEHSFMTKPENQTSQKKEILNPNHVFTGVGVATSNKRLVMVQAFADKLPVKSEPKSDK